MFAEEAGRPRLIFRVFVRVNPSWMLITHNAMEI